MRCKVVVFPGSNCDADCFYVLGDIMHFTVDYVWHKEGSLGDCDLVVLPGGFSYGDYLRTGAIARFSPIMREVARYAQAGKLVLGICNGFQILLEAGLLPGAMVRNRSLRFVCDVVSLRVETTRTPFTQAMQRGSVLQIPIAHGEGNYVCSQEVLQALQDNDQIVFRYTTPAGTVTDAANPNGSIENIAGITNTEGNILGMMPHPERASERALGSADGRQVWESLVARVS